MDFILYLAVVLGVFSAAYAVLAYLATRRELQRPTRWLATNDNTYEVHHFHMSTLIQYRRLANECIERNKHKATMVDLRITCGEDPGNTLAGSLYTLSECKLKTLDEWTEEQYFLRHIGTQELHELAHGFATMEAWK